MSRNVVAIALIALIASACSVSRSASATAEVRSKMAEVRHDSLREEVSQDLNENLTEHEVITEAVICNDSIKVERITDRVTVRERLARREAKKEEVRVVRDTVYVAVRDSTEVRNYGVSESRSRASPVVSVLKWIFRILICVIVLVIVFKLTKFINLFKV